MPVEGAGKGDQRLEHLLRELEALRLDRARHAQAIAHIDATLQRIRKTLPHGTPPADDPAPSRPRKYRKLELTGREFVLDFLRRNGPATAREINHAWRTQGRGGVANNTLVDLQKDRLIERIPTPGERGGTYQLREK